MTKIWCCIVQDTKETCNILKYIRRVITEAFEELQMITQMEKNHMSKNSATRKLLSKIWINLQTIEHNNQIIASIKDDLDRLRYAAEGVKAITYDRERIQLAAAGDRMGDMVADLVEAEQTDMERITRLSIENSNLEQERSQLIRSIINLDNARCSEFLYKRYVECKKISDIQDEMRFKCYNACTNFHSYSLKVFWEKTKNQYNI